MGFSANVLVTTKTELIISYKNCFQKYKNQGCPVYKPNKYFNYKY